MNRKSTQFAAVTLSMVALSLSLLSTSESHAQRQQLVDRVKADCEKLHDSDLRQECLSGLDR